jgi:hypothetical protein
VGFHFLYHKHLACVQYLLDIISGCLMPLEMNTSTTCILAMLLSHLNHMHDISIYNNLEYLMPLCTSSTTGDSTIWLSILQWDECQLMVLLTIFIVSALTTSTMMEWYHLIWFTA